MSHGLSRQCIVMFVFIRFIVVSLVVKTATSEKSEPFIKCCDDKSVLNEKFVCIKEFEDKAGNETISETFSTLTNDTETIYAVCFENGEGGKIRSDDAARYGNNDTCVDVLKNGTRVKLFCDSNITALNDTVQQCDSLFTQVYLWGATIVVFATIIYNIPFIIVVLVYWTLPELRTRAYDKSVISYHLCYIFINSLLIIMGWKTLCHEILSPLTYKLLGLCIMFWTQGAVIWLLIICFDMTLVITRFRWAPKGGSEKGREERRKSLIYAAWGWGFATVLTLIAAIAEFSPILPEDSSLRPNFQNFQKTNVAVIVYVATGPVLICLIDTSLFIYTTAKTIAVQKSTSMIHENRKSNVMKKYFVFLKLYLVMDTPWLTGALGAIYPDLWILKFIKMIQPILVIILIVPRKRVIRAIRCFKGGEVDEPEAARLNNESGKKAKHRATKKIDPAENC